MAAISSSAENWSHTEMKVEKFSYLWTINNFSLCDEEVGEVIKSLKFPVGAKNKLKWRLFVCPRGADEESEGYLSVFLVLCSPHKSEVTVEFSISIMNGKRDSMYTIFSQGSRSFVQHCPFGYSRFITRKMLFDEVNELLPNDTLTVLCELNVVMDQVQNCLESDMGEFKTTECKLSQDLSNIIGDEKFTDVTLTVDGQELKVHKVILAARSDVFAAMFQHNMLECTSNRVEIEDIDYGVFEEVLYYMYTGKAPFKLEEMAGELLSAADKYLLGDLKIMCVKALRDNISIKSAAETLILADLHGVDELKEHAMEYIITNAAYITETKGWQLMIKAYPHLIAQAYKACVEKRRPTVGTRRKSAKYN